MPLSAIDAHASAATGAAAGASHEDSPAMIITHKVGEGSTRYYRVVLFISPKVEADGHRKVRRKLLLDGSKLTSLAKRLGTRSLALGVIRARFLSSHKSSSGAYLDPAFRRVVAEALATAEEVVKTGSLDGVEEAAAIPVAAVKPAPTPAPAVSVAPAPKEAPAPVTAAAVAPPASLPDNVTPIRDITVKTDTDRRKTNWGPVTGTVVQMGMMDRTIFDKALKASKTFKTFGLMIRDEHGIDVPRYGTDLDRAVKEAGVEMGNHVHVVQVGNDNGKNLFRVEKLNMNADAQVNARAPQTQGAA